MSIDEIKELTAEQIEERAAQIKTEIDSADEERLNELNAELDAIEERKKVIVMETRKADMKAVAEGAGVSIASAPVVEKRTNEGVLQSKEYVNAYAEYLRSNDDRECRSLLTVDASGVVPVPAIVEDIIKTAWEKDGIMSRVRRTFVKGNLKVAFERSATGAVVHNEGSSAPSEEDLQLGIVTMIPKNIKKWISISDEAVAMGGETLIRYIYDELTYQIVKKASELAVADVTSANTSHSSSAIGIPQKAFAPSVTTFQKAITALSSEANMSNLCVLLNPASDAAIIDAVAAANFSMDPYAGLTKIYTSALPAYSTADTDAVWAIVGDLSAIQFNFPEGDDVLIKWDDMSLAEADLVKVVGREYAAHAVTAPGRLVNITKPGALT